MNQVQYSPGFQRALELADQFAQHPWPVLILGETGVGKELIAAHIHSKSSTGNFVPINCGAIPSALFESELFGYERGAFSGAVQGSRGLLRSSCGGTIFFDEIGDLCVTHQVKLLRFLDSGEIRSVGGSRVEWIRGRVVAATNVDLGSSVLRGEFRRDLLERLSVLTIRVPPLRERVEDIKILANYFARELEVELSGVCLEVLTEYAWPGNVRQLKNVMIRASIVSTGEIQPSTLRAVVKEEETYKDTVAAPEYAGVFDSGSLEQIENQVIVDRLYKYHGSRKTTARALGISKSSLHEKIRKLKDSSAAPLGWPIDTKLQN